MKSREQVLREPSSFLRGSVFGECTIYPLFEHAELPLLLPPKPQGVHAYFSEDTRAHLLDVRWALVNSPTSHLLDDYNTVTYATDTFLLI